MHSGLNTINFNAHYRLHHILRITLHAATLWWLFYAGFSWTGLAVFLAHYIVGVLSITVAYHRYFSHKTFKASRIVQLIMAAFGCAQMQGGPLIWSAIHRHHHSTSDTPEDLHSPIRGFYESHYGWLMNPKTYQIGYGTPLKDLARFKELVWLDRYSFFPIFGYFAALWLSGHLYAMFNTASDVDGLFVLMWGGRRACRRSLACHLERKLRLPRLGKSPFQNTRRQSQQLLGGHAESRRRLAQQPSQISAQSAEWIWLEATRYLVLLHLAYVEARDFLGRERSGRRVTHKQSKPCAFAGGPVVR